MFKFQASTKFLFGVDTLQLLGQEVKAFGAQKVLIVTDKGIVGAGLLEKVTKPLEEAGIKVAVFDQVEPNPTDKMIVKGGECLQDEQADVVIGLGGGSPIDAAKGIAVMAVNSGSVVEYCSGVEPWAVPPKPIIAIPTTSGTGSEVSGAAMINVPDRGMKMAMFGPSILPDVAIADPMLTLSLPPRLTALTGMDALCHAMEAYVCARANPISDAIAERAIELVGQNLRQAYTNGNNIEARSNMLLASAMAILAATNSGGLGVIHSLAQTLGGYYDLAHGLTISVCFPVGLEYNLLAMPEKHAKMSALLGTNISGMSPIAAAKSVIGAVYELLTDLDITDDLRSLGARPEDFPKLDQLAMIDGCTPVNPRPLNVKAFERLYERAYG